MLIETHEILIMLAPSALIGAVALLAKVLFDRAERRAAR